MRASRNLQQATQLVAREAGVLEDAVERPFGELSMEGTTTT
jgi:hypothetical protein